MIDEDFRGISSLFSSTNREPKHKDSPIVREILTLDNQSSNTEDQSPVFKSQPRHTHRKSNVLRIDSPIVTSSKPTSTMTEGGTEIYSSHASPGTRGGRSKKSYKKHRDKSKYKHSRMHVGFPLHSDSSEDQPTLVTRIPQYPDSDSSSSTEFRKMLQRRKRYQY